MPGPLIAFWLLIGLGGGLSLSDSQAPVWGRVDRSAHGNLGKPIPAEFYITSNVPWVAVATPDVYGREHCLVTLTAWATLSKQMRLVLDGEEQNLSTAWSVDRNLKPTGKPTVFQAVFLNPIGGAVLAVREATVRCVSSPIAAVRDAVLYGPTGLRGYEQPCTCEGKQ